MYRRDRSLARKVGAAISSARRGRGWSQETTAETLGVSANYLGLVERGERLLSLSVLVDACQVLGLSLDEMLLSSQDRPRQEGIEVGRLVAGLSDESRKLMVEIVKTAARTGAKRRRPRR
jgi:transcriptional regulator with XRE-family HTH domain